MDEYTVIEKELISTEILQRKKYEPSNESFFPASLETVVEKQTYKVILITYGRNSQNEQFQEISREELEEPEIKYSLYKNEGDLLVYKEMPKTKLEYEEAKNLGFKGTIEEYLAKRDYT